MRGFFLVFVPPFDGSLLVKASSLISFYLVENICFVYTFWWGLKQKEKDLNLQKSCLPLLRSRSLSLLAKLVMLYCVENPWASNYEVVCWLISLFCFCLLNNLFFFLTWTLNQQRLYASFQEGQSYGNMEIILRKINLLVIWWQWWRKQNKALSFQI